MIMNYSARMPVKVELMGAKRKLNYQIRELSEGEINSLWNEEQHYDAFYEKFAREHKYGYCSVTLGNAQWSYGGIVNAIIRDKYRTDEMEAITNNMAAINAVFMQTLVTGGLVEAIKFLKESADANDAETFREMQEWRAMAKKEAKEVFNTTY